MLDLAAVQEQLHAVHTAYLRLAEIDCPECDHHALIVVRFESPDSVTCPKCGTVLDLLNGDEIQAEIDARNQPSDNLELKSGWINSDRIGANESAEPLARRMRESFEAFCRRVDETHCTSQWSDRGADHD